MKKHYTLMMLYLGSGQEFKSVHRDPPKKEYAFDKPLGQGIDTIFDEPLLHHGQGFDYFVLLAQ
jgi:hypothetical protein